MEGEGRTDGRQRKIVRKRRKWKSACLQSLPVDKTPDISLHRHPGLETTSVSCLSSVTCYTQTLLNPQRREGGRAGREREEQKFGGMEDGREYLGRTREGLQVDKLSDSPATPYRISHDACLEG